MKEPQLVIANGLFFKGEWETPFNVSYTDKEKFYDDRGEEVGEVMMMKLKNHFRYSSLSELGVRVVELPYKVGYLYVFKTMCMWSLGRPRCKWEGNIRMNLKEIGINMRNCVNLAQDWDLLEGPCE